MQRSAAAAKIKLYWARPSQPSRAVKSFLIDTGIEHEEDVLNWYKGEQQKRADIGHLNPEVRVPFITYDG